MSKSRNKKKNPSKRSRNKRVTPKSSNRHSSSESAEPSALSKLKSAFSPAEVEPAKIARQPRRTSTSTTIEWSGPLPAPQILGQFNEIVPGAAERLITTAETEGEHRRSMERRFLKYSFWRELLGVGSGTIVSIVLIAMAAYVATYNTTVASFMASSSFVSAIAVILNKRAGSEQEEQEEQSKPNNNKEGDNLEEEVESKKASLPE